MSLLADALHVLSLIAGQGRAPMAIGRLSHLGKETLAFEKSGSTMFDRDMTGSISVTADTAGLPTGHTLRWQATPENSLAEVEIVSLTAPTTVIKAKRHGTMKLQLEVKDAAGAILEPFSANYAYLSVPAFVSLNFASTGGTVLTDYGIPGSDIPVVMSTLAGVTTSILEHANVRLIWNHPDIQTPIPPQLATEKMTTNIGDKGLTDILPFGTKSTFTVSGRTMFGPGPWINVSVNGYPLNSIPGNWQQTMGATQWSVVSIYPGAINAFLTAWGHPQLGLNPTTVASLPDSIGLKIFARMTGQAIAHEIIHSLRFAWESVAGLAMPPGKILNPHTNPADSNDDVMLEGALRTLTLRTGIVLDAAGNPSDNGVGAMAQTRSASKNASQDILDIYCPRPGRGVLTP